MRARHWIAVAVVLLVATACGSTATGNTGTGTAVAGNVIPSQAAPPPVTVPADPTAAFAKAKTYFGRESIRF